MKREEFIDRLKETLEIDSSKRITEDTDLRQLAEYDSLGVLTVIAMVDEIFGEELSADDLENVATVRDLIKVVGEDRFD